MGCQLVRGQMRDVAIVITSTSTEISLRLLGSRRDLHHRKHVSRSMLQQTEMLVIISSELDRRSGGITPTIFECDQLLCVRDNQQ